MYQVALLYSEAKIQYVLPFRTVHHSEQGYGRKIFCPLFVLPVIPGFFLFRPLSTRRLRNQEITHKEYCFEKCGSTFSHQNASRIDYSFSFVGQLISYIIFVDWKLRCFINPKLQREALGSSTRSALTFALIRTLIHITDLLLSNLLLWTQFSTPPPPSHQLLLWRSFSKLSDKKNDSWLLNIVDF